MRIVIFCPNLIGDAVMATPLLRAVRNQFEGATIDGVMKPAIAATLEGNPWFDQMISFDPQSTDPKRRSLSLLRRLRSERFDLAILLPNSFRSALMARLAGARDRIGYARGGVMWGPLVALEHEGEVVAGAMELPVLRAAYWAGRGLGCFRDGERVRVSTTDLWRRAVVSLGGMKRVLFEHPRAAAIEGLVRSARSGRAYGDVGSCAMLLDGTADVWLEAGVRVWDLAAPRILVEEAGGRFTDFAGRPGHATGEAVASNGVLHDHVLAALSG